MARFSVRFRYVALHSSASNKRKIGLELTLASLRRLLPRRLLAHHLYGKTAAAIATADHHDANQFQSGSHFSQVHAQTTSATFRLESAALKLGHSTGVFHEIP